MGSGLDFEPFSNASLREARNPCFPAKKATSREQTVRMQSGTICRILASTIAFKAASCQFDRKAGDDFEANEALTR